MNIDTETLVKLAGEIAQGEWRWDDYQDALIPVWEIGMSQGYGYIDWLGSNKEADARAIALVPDLLAEVIALRGDIDRLSASLAGEVSESERLRAAVANMTEIADALEAK